MAATGYAWRYRQRTLTDPLTGLANRAALQMAFRRHRRTGPVAVAVGDMNGFKAFNDTHGHRFGDQVLIEVARVLARETSRGELPVRLHGDEFAVLIPGVKDQATAEHRVRQLQDAIAQITTIDGQPVEVSMALGVMTMPAESADLSRLLGSADDRMYGDKHINRSRTEIAIPQPQ
ncbi:GGDEF domain-containing protein [Saccharopolyspora mangrovi]|uniref:GGDEF domain-containing protein n=1 Tax=Saccharopolyspora mangrovi TaxID=3082379 RepID=A0ABU6ADB2_9PSEU|nr:GGDEF domain-containing protein [Saccharopolyspora sp. S2-29]MEB3369535.1 GGDEF domain-containing protein [Saccharopolyspora sp. S2-29]